MSHSLNRVRVLVVWQTSTPISVYHQTLYHTTIMMECESIPATVPAPNAVASAKILTRREEVDSGIPWVEKYRPQRYVCHWVDPEFGCI